MVSIQLLGTGVAGMGEAAVSARGIAPCVSVSKLFTSSIQDGELGRWSSWDAPKTPWKRVLIGCPEDPIERELTRTDGQSKDYDGFDHYDDVGNLW